MCVTVLCVLLACLVSLEAVVVRNVVLIGRSRVGKSTTVEVLKDAQYIAPMERIFVGTKEPTIHRLKNTLHGITYHINIMDTPGLFERTEDNKARDNGILVNITNDLIRNGFSEIHRIYYCISIVAGLSSEDIETLKQFMAVFHGAENKGRMIVTRAESYSDKKREKIVNEIREIPEIGHFSDTILFAGATPEDIKDEFPSWQSNNIDKMRNDILNDIYTANDPVPVRKLDIYRLNVPILWRISECWNDSVPILEKIQNIVEELLCEAMKIFRQLTAHEEL